MTNEQKNAIRKLRETGHGYGEIAGTLGLTKNQVSAYCRRNSLSYAVSSGSVKETLGDVCLCCGKALVQTEKHKKKKFCGCECRVKWWNSHLNKVKRTAFYQFKCTYCGKTFTSYGNNHRKYCSHECYIKDRFGGERSDGRAV